MPSQSGFLCPIKSQEQHQKQYRSHPDVIIYRSRIARRDDFYFYYNLGIEMGVLLLLCLCAYRLSRPRVPTPWEWGAIAIGLGISGRCAYWAYGLVR